MKKNKSINSVDSIQTPENSTKFLKTLINLNPDIIYIYDLNEQKNIYSNDGVQKILGYSSKEIKEMGSSLIKQLMHPDDFTNYLKTTYPSYKSLKENQTHVHQYRMKHKNGSWKYLEASETVYKRCVDGSPSQIFGVIHDITLKTQIYEELHNSNIYIENIINTANTLVIGLDINGNINIFNNTASQITGYSLNDLKGHNWFEVLVPREKYPNVWEEFERLKAEGVPKKFENPILTKDGKERFIIWQNSIIYQDNKPSGTISFGLDITERKQIEENLKKSEEKYRLLFDTMTQGVVYQNKEGAIINANPAAQRILGLSLDQMQGITSMDPMWKAVREDGSIFPGELHPISVALKTGKEVNNVIHGIYHPEKKQIIWIKVNAVPLFKKGENTPYQAYAMIEDITDKRQSEEKYKMLFVEMLGSFALHEIICDENNNPIDYRFLDINPSFEKITGLKAKDIIGKTVLEIMPRTEKEWIERFGKVAITGEPDFFENYSGELDKYFEVTAFRPAPNQFACIFTDVTQRKKTEELLNKTQKLESIGLLAGGIAHDFNNLLGGVFGYIDLANSDDLTDEEKKIFLNKSLQTIHRARALTQQLLTFSKGGEPIKKVDKLFPFIKETSEFALSGANISINFDIEDTLWFCDFDKNQIGQVIDNIIINASQAMPTGGQIHIKARNISLKSYDFLTLRKGNYCKISIKDFGIGIPKEYISKIFDPFFSTKEKGHGLGLATSYSIIKRHGGTIDVESTPGKGTSFHIYLPSTNKPFTSKIDDDEKMHKGSGIFILMDDEKVIQETVSHILKSFGYYVFIAKNGSETIDFFLENINKGKKIVGLILDLTIPGGTGGKDVIKQIRKIDSKTPAFVSSGYADDPIMSNPSEYGFTASISKPFKKNDLSVLLNNYMPYSTGH